MKIVFCSNYLNHHQLPLCEELRKLPDIDFYFIATTSVPQERLALGYADMNKLHPFVICTYDSEEGRLLAEKKILEADVAILGHAPNEMVESRLKRGGLTLRYSERLLKTMPGFLENMLKKLIYPTRYNKKSYYLLCASAYTAGDYAFYRSFKGKTFKWGYFPAVKEHADEKQLFAQKKPGSILWAGRMIDWKHPDLCLRVAKRLKEDGYSFVLNMIGTGTMQQELKDAAAQMGLDDCVHFLGSMSPEQVRLHMEESQIYLFTSDRNEGWGAVLNESMNSGCAVIANRAIGSAPFLLQDAENGLIYEDGDEEAVYQSTKRLLEDPALAERLGTAAYHTMLNEWSPCIAAARLLELCRALEQARPTPFAKGPCSVAIPLSDTARR